MAKTHYRTCPLCEATCGLEVTTDGDQIVRIRGDRDDPFSRGFICPKGSTLKQLHEDPDRLTTPMLRTDDGWQEIGWDDAFAEIARRLDPIIAEHGRHSLSVVLGNPNVHNLGGTLYLRHVIKAIGSTNIFSASTVDQMPKHVSCGLLWGDPGLFPLPDIERTDYLLMLGANPYASNGSLWTVPDFPGRLNEMKDRGGRFVVVDPRRSKTAQNAHEHLHIRPGTDTLWQLALINTLFDEDLVEVGRLADHISGVDEVRSAVENFSAEAVADTCRIDAETTRRIARELANAPTAAVYGRMGVHTTEFGALGSWASDVLNILTGNLDSPGGVMFNCAPTVRFDALATPGGRGFEMGRWNGRATGRPEVLGELPAASLAEEMETPGDGRIRAMFLIASNPVRSFPNSERLNAALAELDLLVAIDPYITASSRHADIILPPTSALERSHYDFTFERTMIRSFAKYSPAVFDVDRPDESEILCRLALTINGDPDADPATIHAAVITEAVSREVAKPDSPIVGRDPEEILTELGAWSWAEQTIDLRLRVGRFGDGFGANPSGLTLQSLIDDHPHGVDFGPLESRFPGAIKTRSGTVELWSEPIATDFGRLDAHVRSDDGLVLVGRRHLRSCNTWMHNVDVLIKGRERCTLVIHPDDATEAGLVEGGIARICSRVGEVQAPVEISTDIMPGVVSLPFGWGYDEAGIEMRTAATRPGVNSNALTDDQPLDDLSGNAVLNGIPVEVVPG
jgi:anaerobic selenocysteine-containing dehydrogenase